LLFNLNMKLLKLPLVIIALSCYAATVMAQTPASLQTVIKAETDLNKAVARKGIKDAYLAVADPEGMVFKPEPIKITDFYGRIDKQPGKLTWEPKFARISASGDLAVTAGPYLYTKDKSDTGKVYGDYVSVWRGTLADKNLKLLFNLGIQHPESTGNYLTDMKEPDAAKATSPSKDPFNGKTIILNTDKSLNASLKLSALGTYKEFFETEGHFYFPGFEPMMGHDQIMKFLANQAITITAETVNAGRAASNDLAYSYGRARIRKGNIVSNYNYVRVWEQDAKHRWNVALEVLSAIEND